MLTQRIYSFSRIKYILYTIIFMFMVMHSSGCSTTSSNLEQTKSQLSKAQRQRLQSLSSVEIIRKDDFQKTAWVFEKEGYLLWKIEPGETKISWLRPATYTLIITDNRNMPSLANADYTPVTLTLKPGRHHKVELGLQSISEEKSISDIITNASIATALIIFSVTTGTSGSIILPSILSKDRSSSKKQKK